MKLKKKKIFIIVLLSLLCCFGIVGGYFYLTLKSRAFTKTGEVYINQNGTYKTLIDSLDRHGYIRNKKIFDLTAKRMGLNKNVRPGHYRFEENTNYIQAVRMFQRGLQTPVRVTFNNIRTLPQLAGRISQQIEPDSLSLVQTFFSDTSALHYGFNEANFISMFIPDTYEMYWTATPVGFLDRMKKEYDRFWNEEREKKLAALNMSRTEVSTLASIVFEETKMSDEMPTVAGVYINRLKKGMKLQADPTVKFALEDFALKRILFRHLEIDSPYNTYLYAGLPPGPICMPSVTAIDAVLNYQHHNYLFFCAKPDFSGYHNFAVTNEQHNRNRNEWIKALNNAGIR